MDYIYIDESGDLGSKSKYFIIAAIKFSNEKIPKNLVKKTFRTYSK